MHKTMAWILLLMCSLFVANVSAAEPPHQGPPTPAAVQSKKEAPKAQTQPVAEKLSTTEHELKVGNDTLKYRATAGTMPLKDEAGKTRANFFFVAYEKIADESTEKRPITFVFNGGPGAAAIWLHLGTAGPKRVELSPEGFPGVPPFHLIDNSSTWLWQTDLVFIDPVGTGYSRAAEGVKGEEFYGVQQDIDSVSEFIRLYLVKSQRMGSPKFIAGESYGTTRAALLSEHLLDRQGIALNGVILISTVLSFQAISPTDANELPYPLYLPTYTAAAFYHQKLSSELQADLKKTLKEVKKWATDVYTPALLMGDRLPDDQRKKIVSDMARYTGLSEEFIEKANLRVAPFVFEKALLASRRQVIGRFDSRITGASMDDLSIHPEHDPSLSRYVGVYSETFNRYVRQDLKFESDLMYEYLSGRVQPWNWGRGANGGWLYVGDNLKAAIVKNPTMKVLVCSGYFDLATPFFATDYTISHLNLTPELRKNIKQTYYEGGHMMYHHQKSLEKLNADVKAFMESAVEK
jgi:carboxypeptidase C (cathepsin A)